MNALTFRALSRAATKCSATSTGLSMPARYAATKSRTRVTGRWRLESPNWWMKAAGMGAPVCLAADIGQSGVAVLGSSIVSCVILLRPPSARSLRANSLDTRGSSTAHATRPSRGPLMAGIFTSLRSYDLVGVVADMTDSPVVLGWPYCTTLTEVANGTLLGRLEILSRFCSSHGENFSG